MDSSLVFKLIKAYKIDAIGANVYVYENRDFVISLTIVNNGGILSKVASKTNKGKISINGNIKDPIIYIGTYGVSNVISGRSMSIKQDLKDLETSCENIRKVIKEIYLNSRQ